jgi:hypothetical protein
MRNTEDIKYNSKEYTTQAINEDGADDRIDTICLDRICNVAKRIIATSAQHNADKITIDRYAAHAYIYMLEKTNNYVHLYNLDIEGLHPPRTGLEFKSLPPNSIATIPTNTDGKLGEIRYYRESNVDVDYISDKQWIDIDNINKMMLMRIS